MLSYLDVLAHVMARSILDFTAFNQRQHEQLAICGRGSRLVAIPPGRRSCAMEVIAECDRLASYSFQDIGMLRMCLPPNQVCP